MMRIACVTGLKNSNATLREWIDHYMSIGINDFIFLDNNDVDGENPLDVLEDIKEHVIIVGGRGNTDSRRQMTFFTMAYKLFNKHFDGLLYVDDDEYLVLNQDDNITDYLSRPMFKDVDTIHFNWKMYGDNGLVHPLKGVHTFEQFPEPMPLDFKYEYPFPQNFHIKTLVLCKGKNIECYHPHFCTGRDCVLNCVNASGAPIRNDYPWTPYDYTFAELRHYQMRSTEEFCKKRLFGRGSSMYDGSAFNPQVEIARYFAYNERTPEKEEVIKKWCSDKGIKI